MPRPAGRGNCSRSVPLVALIVAMGVYPKPVLDVINPAVKATMSQVGVH